ncbi:MULTISPECIES: hypothetical protein [Bacillati]|uniref:LexA repressor DNA-binding domain-containing protein n=1 Tax=Cohnella cellulosilytica TaxID=986710 RepID=A0ABW2FH13_9BACL
MSKASQALTRVEAQALEIIKLFINENGYAPSIRELADAMNYNSSSTAFNVVERLRKKGAIATGRNGPRTIRVLRENGDERIDKIVEQCGQIGEYDDEEFTPPQFLDDLEGDAEGEFWEWISTLLQASARKSINLYLDR